MNITISAIRCSLQIALLGAITPNLRALNVEFTNDLIKLFYYYETSPSDVEVENSEVVASEVVSDFVDASIYVNRIVLSKNHKIPDIGIKVFQRMENS